MRIKVLAFALFFLSFSLSVAGAQEASPGDRQFLDGQWKKAIPQYEAELAENPSVEKLSRLGEAYFYANNFAAAERTFGKALEAGPSPRARILLAMVQAVRDEGKLEGLIGLEKDYGEDALLLRSIGAALLHHKYHDRAMAYFHRAEAADPGDYMSPFYIGLIHERKHQYSECMEAYKKSVALNPRFAQAVNNLGYCYKERRFYTYAMEMYERALAIEPDNAGFHYNLGNAQTHKGMTREALEHYKQAVAIDPTFAKAHYNVGRSYIALGMLEEGIKELRLYIKHWDKALLKTDAPPIAAVKEEIADIEEAIEESKKPKEPEEEPKIYWEDRIGVQE